MRFESEFLVDRQVLVVRAHGPGDETTARRFIAVVKAAPAYHPGTPILIDGADSPYLPSAQDAQSFPDLFDRELPGSRVAFIPRDDAAFGMGRMISTLSGCQGVPFAVFRSTDDAMRWLTSRTD